jgi:hypothetical protein
MATKRTINWVEAEAEPSPRDAVVREIVGATIGGKEVKLEITSTGLWFISFVSGGELPEALQGHWTHRVRAEEVIQSYLNA